MHFLLHLLFGILLAVAERFTRLRHGASDAPSHFGVFMLIWAPLQLVSALLIPLFGDYSENDRLVRVFSLPVLSLFGMGETAYGFFTAWAAEKAFRRLRFHWDNMKE